MAVLTYTGSSFFRFALVVLYLCTCSDAQRFKGFRKFIDVSEATPHMAKAVEDHWFIQRLDHFNGADTRVWKQVSRWVGGPLDPT